MKYQIRTERLPELDLDAIETALGERDPAGLVDQDPSRALLRFATCLDGADVLALMADAGFPIEASALEGVPSECCGGCGG
ncbi:MAG: hypothetical protein IT474_08375 [Arenimonas sp.]|nr:hypothetical protein [Arenimonas sp.]